MRWCWVLVLCWTLFGADERRLALVADAQRAFERVDLSPSPQLADASACVQMEAAALAVALPASEASLHYRKGYCELAVAAITRAPTRFAEAASELDQSGAAMLAWIARQAQAAAQRASDDGGQSARQFSGPTGEPAAAPSTGQSAGRNVAQTWTTPDTCPASCQPFIPAASLWLGWLALRRGDLDAAAEHFAVGPESGWAAFVAGMRAFRAGRYSEAAARYGETLAIWSRDQNGSDPPLAWRLGPPADIAQLLAELGGAQILAGDPQAAVATLDKALKTGDPAARTFFLRARAKELSGQPEPALADYNLASRTAFADATDLASGEAHLYRGILYYRRKDYARAEDEFSSALNFAIAPALRPDASAWRHLSAVASGFCGASRAYLERSLPAVSPFFPIDEARAVAAGCPAGALP
jgi:tetratricopeptide (TPR) repeat protein